MTTTTMTTTTGTAPVTRPTSSRGLGIAPCQHAGRYEEEEQRRAEGAEQRRHEETAREGEHEPALGRERRNQARVHSTRNPKPGARLS